MFLRNWARLYSKRTTPEVLLERVIAFYGKPYRAQHPFFRLHRIVDFALLDDKIVIEVDGASHLAVAQRRKDLASAILLEKEGWKVVRLSNEEVMADPKGAFDMAIGDRLTHRPTLAELESALQDLDREFPGLSAKPRRKRRAPAPKKARARRASKAGNSSEDTIE
jgi:very-short-patch-repair endonuclease